jgi:hypothetical protein
MEDILTNLIETGETFEITTVIKYCKVSKFWERHYDPKPYNTYEVNNPTGYIQWEADVKQYISLYQTDELPEYKRLFHSKRNHDEIIAKLKAIKKVNKNCIEPKNEKNIMKIVAKDDYDTGKHYAALCSDEFDEKKGSTEIEEIIGKVNNVRLIKEYIYEQKKLVEKYKLLSLKAEKIKFVTPIVSNLQKIIVDWDNNDFKEICAKNEISINKQIIIEALKFWKEKLKKIESNKQEITGEKNNRKLLFWTIAGVIVALIAAIATIVGIFWNT